MSSHSFRWIPVLGLLLFVTYAQATALPLDARKALSSTSEQSVLTSMDSSTSPVVQSIVRSAVAVPEPAGFWLLTIALVALSAVRRARGAGSSLSRALKVPLALLLVACGVVPFAAQAGNNVSMQLTGVEGPSLGGVYTDPYRAKIGAADQVLTRSSEFTVIPAATNVYCDDFNADMHTGQIWQATVTNMSALAYLTTPLTSLEFDTHGSAAKQQQDYMAIAWLAEQIAGTDQSSTAGRMKAQYMSYALWDVFDPGWNGALHGLSWSDRNAALSDVNLAYSQVAMDSPSEFSNVNIYTPDPQHSAQEFLTVSPKPSVPEPGTLLLFALAIAGSVAIGLRRKTRARASP